MPEDLPPLRVDPRALRASDPHGTGETLHEALKNVERRTGVNLQPNPPASSPDAANPFPETVRYMTDHADDPPRKGPKPVVYAFGAAALAAGALLVLAWRLHSTSRQPSSTR